MRNTEASLQIVRTNAGSNPALSAKLKTKRNEIKIMFELTHKDGFKVLAEYKDGLGWFDLQGYQLKDDCFVWCDELK